MMRANVYPHRGPRSPLCTIFRPSLHEKARLGHMNWTHAQRKAKGLMGLTADYISDAVRKIIQNAAQYGLRLDSAAQNALATTKQGDRVCALLLLQDAKAGPTQNPHAPHNAIADASKCLSCVHRVPRSTGLEAVTQKPRYSPDYVGCGHPEALTEVFHQIGRKYGIGMPFDLSPSVMNVRLNGFAVSRGLIAWPYLIDPLWVEACSCWEKETATIGKDIAA